MGDLSIKDKFKIMSKRINLKSIIIIIAILAILFVGGYYWWIGTPQYSLFQIKKAYKTHNADLALKYIDSDAIFENYWTEYIEKTMTETSSSNGFETLGKIIALQMIQNMKPTIKDVLKQTIIKSFSENQESNNDSEFTKNLNGTWGSKPKISRKGNTVTVDLSNNIKLIMTKNNHYWVVTKIEGLN
ncbi:MAG: hypothetical protein WA092_01560 [Minisyncoccales bacterium]